MKTKRLFFALTILFIITNFLIINKACATKYYISATGNDSNNGLTPSTPWLTLIKINGYGFSPGDSLLFRRGDIWRGQLSNVYDGSAAGGYITYSAYGSGAKPKILGSKDLSTTDSWENLSGNIWKTTGTTPAKDCANLIFNNETTWGIKKQTLNACTSNGHFYFNPSDHKIYLYSTSNPGSRYNNIEAGGVYSENVIEFINAKYIVFDNLDVRYSGNNGIFLESSDHIIVENCDFSWIGGWYVPGDDVRMGNAVQMWIDNSNITVRYNRINQVYDAGISPQGGTYYTQSNINMYYNLITNCWYSYETWVDAGVRMENVNFYNNTCVNAGSQWSANQRPDKGNARHVMIWIANSIVINCNIKNNIFKTSANSAIRYGNNTSKFVFNNNLYYVLTVAVTNNKTYTTLGQWRAATSQDANSVSIDPLFVSSSDFSLQSGSPAINGGINVGLLKDFIGSPIVGNPDMGAFEYLGENHAPSILNQSYQIAKNSPDGTVVGTVVASDPDADQTLEYSILSGNTEGAFAINTLTGVLSVANSIALTADFALVVKVIDNGIGELSNQATITINIIPTGIELTGNNSTIKVYPNPVSNELIIENEEDKDSPGFEIFNSTGQIVFKGNLSERTVVQTTNFSPGIYIIKIEDGSFFKFKKIIRV